MSRQAKKDESLIVAASKITYREKLVVLLLISIFILLIFIAFTGFSPFVVKLSTADANSVYQGIGIGCLLSIFAIVISLALMAVQYASQQYTHRIMDFYTKSRMFQCILFIYMGTIFYNMLMLTEKTVNPTHVFVSLSLSALCILALLPHFFITMIHLKPGFIIGKMLSGINKKDIDSLKGLYLFSIDTRLEEELNEDSISEELRKEFETNRFSLSDNATVMKKEEEKKWEIIDEKKFTVRKEDGELNIYKGLSHENSASEEDTLLLPITEIIERAIRNGDQTTAKKGLDEIKNCYLNYLSPRNEDYVSPYFLKLILNVGRVAGIEKDDGSMARVLNIFGDVGRNTVSERMNFSTKIVLEYIDTMGFKALQNYDTTTEQMIKSLQDILRAFIESGKGKEEKETLKRIFALYSNLSDELFKLKKDKMITYMLNSFSEPHVLMVKNECYETIEKTAELLVGISENAAKRGLRDPIDLSIRSLQKIGISSARKKLMWKKTPAFKRNIAKDCIIEHLTMIEEAVSTYESKLKDSDIIRGEIGLAKEGIKSCL